MIKLENAGLRAPRKISLGSGLHSQKSIRAPVSKMIGLRAPQQKISGLQGSRDPPFGTLNIVYINSVDNEYCPVNLVKKYMKAASISFDSNLPLFRPLIYYKRVIRIPYAVLGDFIPGVEKCLRRNPIEDGVISGFSGQNSVPE